MTNRNNFKHFKMKEEIQLTDNLMAEVELEENVLDSENGITKTETFVGINRIYIIGDRTKTDLHGDLVDLGCEAGIDRIINNYLEKT